MTLLCVSVSDTGLSNNSVRWVRARTSRIPNSYSPSRHVERFGTAGVRVASARTLPPQSAGSVKISRGPSDPTCLPRAVRTRVVEERCPGRPADPKAYRRGSAAVRFRLMLGSASTTNHRTGDSARPPPLRVMVALVGEALLVKLLLVPPCTSTHLGLARGLQAHLIPDQLRQSSGLTCDCGDQHVTCRDPMITVARREVAGVRSRSS